ncbi:hypothetical protein [Asinibacterium sp. OR53]|uniref:hypothetical protein n=1 Tax=Asinibacterium sp. OR53 TaxID=925409 RepID=UPI00047CEE26|nr:hypothetical protein [Asinibacterium sp. OR53]
MTPKILYLELLDTFYKLKGWENKTLGQVKEHQEEADQELFRLVMEGMVEKEIGAIIKALGIKSITSFESFLDYQPIYTEAIKMLTIMQLSNNMKEFQAMNAKLKKNSQKEKPSKELTDFDKLVKAFASVPKSEILKKKKGDK